MRRQLVCILSLLILGFALVVPLGLSAAQAAALQTESTTPHAGPAPSGVAPNATASETPPAAAAHLAASSTRTVQLQIAVHLNNQGAGLSHVYLNVPLVTNDASAYQTIRHERFSKSLKDVTGAGTLRSGSFQLAIAGHRAADVVQTYTLALHGYRRTAVRKGAAETPSQPTPTVTPLTTEERTEYLADGPGIEVSDPRLQAVARSLAAPFQESAVASGHHTTGLAAKGASPTDVHAEAATIFAYVHNHLRYDPKSPAAHEGALAAWQDGSGMCTEFARLFVALARGAGIPSRIVNGEVLLDRDGNLATGSFATFARHEWAEYYDPQQGWVPADPTYAAALDDSLRLPDYVRENEGDRNVTGSFDGGRIAATMTITVTPAVVASDPSATGRPAS